MEVSEWIGDYAAATAYANQSLALGRSLRRPEVLIFCNWFLGKVRCCTGDLGGALTLLRDAYDLCDRIGDRAWKSRMLNTLGWCYAEMCSVDRARECNEAGAALAREIGDPEILSNADINLALNHLALGDWSGATRSSPASSRRWRAPATRGCAGATACTSTTRAPDWSWRAARPTPPWRRSTASWPGRAAITPRSSRRAR
jgi:hypothetical protein